VEKNNVNALVVLRSMLTRSDYLVYTFVYIFFPKFEFRISIKFVKFIYSQEHNNI